MMKAREQRNIHIQGIIFLAGIITFLFILKATRSQQVQGRVYAQAGVDINIAFFGTDGCETCQEIKEFFLPQFIKQYPQIKIHYFDLDDLKNYQKLLQLEKKYGQETTGSPVFVIGEHILAGREEIEGRLEKYVRLYLQQGGCTLPTMEETEVSSHTEANSPPIYLALFLKPGCQKCDRTETNLKYLKSKYPSLHVKQFDVSQPENILIQEILAETVGISGDQSLLAPMAIAGGDYLALEDLTYGNLEMLIQKYQATGSVCLWANLNLKDASSSTAHTRIAARFQKLGPLAILGSGLLDGINPCAFATIIFLLSWLAFMGKKGKDLLWVGTSFALAVFLTYFFLGLGMFQFLKGITRFKSLHILIFMVMALGTFIFGILSIRDFFKIRQGKTREVSLQLPRVFKKRIHRVIKEKTNVKGVAAAAFMMGAIISLLELACTGQVYLPTIMVVTEIPQLKHHAIFYLALYNLAFILPLVVVFLVTYHGSSSKQLAEVMERHLATTKLLTGVFFFLMTLLLIAALLLRFL